MEVNLRKQMNFKNILKYFLACKWNFIEVGQIWEKLKKGQIWEDKK